MQMMATDTVSISPPKLLKLSSDQPDQNASNNFGADVAARDRQPERFVTDLALTKTVDNPSPAVGDQIVYTITIINQSTTSTAGVSVRDVLPPEVSFVSATSSVVEGASCQNCGYNPSNGLWTIGNLKKGTTETLQIVVTVTGSGEITNTAEVATSTLPDEDSSTANGDPGEDDQDSATINVGGGKSTSAFDLSGLPSDYELHPAYPNPFNPQTRIPYGVPETGAVRLEVYNMLGQRVAVLVARVVEAGRHEVVWEAGRLPTGLYVVRLEAGEQVLTRKLTLLK